MSAFWSTYKIPLILGGMSMFLFAGAVAVLVKATMPSESIRFTNTIPDRDCSSSELDVAQSCTVVATPGPSSQNGGGISVNHASQSELELLPGVGPVMAKKIIDNRPYTDLNDLLTKKAVGPSVFEKIGSLISL